jgi:large subunit ribosomal protein L13
MNAKTYSVRESEIERRWYVVDATDETLGRLASRIAHVLEGKHKPTYQPSLDSGDHVIVLNAARIAVTSDKLESKLYSRHSGYPAGFKQETLGQLLARRPEEVIRRGRQGDAAAQSARDPAAAQAEGLPRVRSSAQGSAA